MVMGCDPQREGAHEKSEVGILGEGGEAGGVSWTRVEGDVSEEDALGEVAPERACCRESGEVGL